MCRSFDWSHMATLFIWSSGRAMYTLVYFNPPIKIKTKTESKNLQPELFRGKYVWTHAHICDSRKSAGKTEGLQGWAGPKSSINLVVLARMSPNFLFLSRELHLVCSPTWVYSRKGAHSSHFLLFYIVFMSTILNRDGNYVCVLFRIFISKNKKHRKLQFYQHRISKHNQKLEVTTT